MRTLIRGARVFDGSRTTERADVLIDGGLIAEPDGGRADTEVDGTGRTLLPGLIDAHTHTFDGSLEQALPFGVTTALDMFCLPSNLARQRRTAAERDDVADIRSSGVLATAPGGHPSQLMAGFDDSTLDGLGDAAGPFATVAGPSGAKEFVEARIAEGIDYLKIVVDDGEVHGGRFPTLAPDTVAALVEAAHAAGLRAIAHAMTARDTAIALDAGVDGLAHVYCDARLDDPAAQRLAARIATQGVFVVSTLVYFEAVTAQAEGPDPIDRLPESNAAMAVHAARSLYWAGASLMAGTDSNPFAPAHGAGMHRELELLVQAGLGNEEVLAAATSVPAHHFGLTDRGRVAPGLRADLLLVDGDPTRDITATAAIADVWRRGVRLAR